MLDSFKVYSKKDKSVLSMNQVEYLTCSKQDFILLEVVKDYETERSFRDAEQKKLDKAKDDLYNALVDSCYVQKSDKAYLLFELVLDEWHFDARLDSVEDLIDKYKKFAVLL